MFFIVTNDDVYTIGLLVVVKIGPMFLLLCAQ